MSTLDGKITIARELRQCIVSVPAKIRHIQNTSTQPGQYIIEKSEYETKALFHCWHPVTGNGIVEYEDGTIHEVEPTQVRFVDNAMSEYVFQEDKGEKEKVLDVLREICPECGGNMRIDEGIVLTSNPPQYRLKCDKCGHIKYSGIKYNISDNYD